MSFIIQSVLLLTSIFYQGTLGSPLGIGRDSYLRDAIFKSAHSRCYTDKTKGGFIGLGWYLKESVGHTKEYIQQGIVTEDMLKPDPNLVEAYTEYFCRTYKFPLRGKLPNPSVLNLQVVEKVK